MGDCLLDDIIGEGGQIEGGQAVVDCSSEHDSEVYSSKDLTDSTFPGTAPLSRAAEDFCGASFRAFVGMSYDDSILQLSYLFPTTASWRNGDREILCLVYDPDGDTIGTLRGANR